MSKLTLMKTRIRVRTSIENILGLQLSHGFHHGFRDCTDIKKSNCQISLIVDIGANIGQSALKFKAVFPQARICCFEPVKGTFEILKRNLNKYNDISCYKIALGSCSSNQATIYLTDQSNTNSLIPPKTFAGTETVDLRTVDSFAFDNQIKRIDLLKIDAEGFDLEVLKGAQNMLSSGQVAFVLTEVTFHPGDSRHVLFDDVRSYLLPMGFSVFGIYDQQLEWSGKQRLRFANACFLNERAIISAR